MLGMVACAYNLSTEEAGTGGFSGAYWLANLMN